MNNYDLALIQFTNSFLDKDYAKHPFRQGMNNYATDGKSIIRVATHLCKEEYEELDKPNAEYVMNKQKNRDKLFSYEGLCQTLDLVPKVNFESCDACGGEGQVEFEFEYDGHTYYHSNTCPICNGTGKVELSTEKRDFRYGIKFEKYAYPIAQDQLVLLMKIMKEVDVSTARLVYAEPSIYKFELNKDVEVMFCGYFPGQKLEDYFICCKEEEQL